ncbi:hypothetical protein Tco_1491867 [Tanacetum coccineum]
MGSDYRQMGLEVDNRNHNEHRSHITHKNTSGTGVVEGIRKDFKNHRKNSDLDHKRMNFQLSKRKINKIQRLTGLHIHNKGNIQMIVVRHNHNAIQGCIIHFMLLFLQLPVFRRQDAEKDTIVSIGDVHKQQPEAPDEEYEEYLSHLFGDKCPSNLNEVQDLRRLSFQNVAVCIGVDSGMSRVQKDVGYMGWYVDQNYGTYLDFVLDLLYSGIKRSTVHKGPPSDNTYLGVTKRMPLLRRSFWYKERLKALPKGGAPHFYYKFSLLALDTVLLQL